MEFTYTRDMIYQDIENRIYDFERYYDIDLIVDTVFLVLKKAKIEKHLDYLWIIDHCAGLVQLGWVGREREQQEMDEDNLEEW